MPYTCYRVYASQYNILEENGKKIISPALQLALLIAITRKLFHNESFPRMYLSSKYYMHKSLI